MWDHLSRRKAGSHCPHHPFQTVGQSLTSSGPIAAPEIRTILDRLEKREQSPWRAISRRAGRHFAARDRRQPRRQTGCCWEKPCLFDLSAQTDCPARWSCGRLVDAAGWGAETDLAKWAGERWRKDESPVRPGAARGLRRHWIGQRTDSVLFMLAHKAKQVRTVEHVSRSQRRNDTPVALLNADGGAVGERKGAETGREAGL